MNGIESIIAVPGARKRMDGVYSSRYLIQPHIVQIHGRRIAISVFNNMESENKI
jgi:hypothetical protein